MVFPENDINGSSVGLTLAVGESCPHINDNLQQQLKLIYDYWFSQFDFPNEDGKPYRASGGVMEWCAPLKKYVPAGWITSPIIELATIYQPQTISNDWFDDDYAYNVYGGGGLIGKYKEYNHEESEIILSCRGNCGNVIMTMPFSWITGNAMVVHPNSITKSYLYEFLISYGVQKYITGSVQKQLTRENLSCMPIIVPPKGLLALFDNISSPILSQMQKIEYENQNLYKIRDWLLPLLMNGQAIISD